MTRLLHPPLLVCVDFQREYIAHGRPLCVANAVSLLLPRAARLLALARSEAWLIAHSLVQRDDVLFGKRTEHVQPLPGFEPNSSEMVFCREGFSAFGNPEFARLIDRNRGSLTLLMGLGGPFSLLHTALDAHARRDEVVLVEDVLGAPAMAGCTDDQVVAVIRSIAGSMHRLVASEDILRTSRTTHMIAALGITAGGD